MSSPHCWLQLSYIFHHEIKIFLQMLVYPIRLFMTCGTRSPKHHAPTPFQYRDETTLTLSISRLARHPYWKHMRCHFVNYHNLCNTSSFNRVPVGYLTPLLHSWYYVRMRYFNLYFFKAHTFGFRFLEQVRISVSGDSRYIN